MVAQGGYDVPPSPIPRIPLGHSKEAIVCSVDGMAHYRVSVTSQKDSLLNV